MTDAVAEKMNETERAGASTRTGDPSAEGEGAGLSVEGLRKSYIDRAGGIVEVLRGVTLRVAPGERVAVMGASGAGKTTLLHIIGGLEEASGGRALLDGFSILDARGPHLAAWRGGAVGFVFQSHHLLADLSAEENVALPLLIARRDGREATLAAREMLDAVGLSRRAGHAAGEMSGGEQQRVALARALVTRPRLILADEPTGNLDARTGNDVSELLLRLARETRSCLLLATHNERLARDCDRRLLLNEGLATEAADA